MYRNLSIIDSTTLGDILAQIDARMLTLSTGDPTGSVAAPLPGVFCLDTVSNILYFAKTGDNTVLGTEWVTYPESASKLDITNGVPGVFVAADLMKSLLDGRAEGDHNYLVNGEFKYWSYGETVTPSTNRYVVPGVYASRATHGGIVFTPVYPTDSSQYYRQMKISRLYGDTNTATLSLEMLLNPEEVASLRGEYITATLDLLPSSVNSLVGNSVELSVIASPNTTPQLHSVIPYSSFVSLGNVTEVLSLIDYTPVSISGLIPLSTQNVSVILKLQYSGTATGLDNLIVARAVMVRGANRVIPRSFSDDYDRVTKRYFSTFPAGVTPGQNMGVNGAVYGTCTNSGSFEYYVRFPKPMDYPYFVTTYNPVNTNSSARNITGSTDVALNVTNLSKNGFRIYAAANGANANATLSFHYQVVSEPV